jgi:putative ABC transport system permease protein
LSLAAMLDLAPVEITRQTFSPISLDWRILLFALAISLATGVVFGSLPAWRAGRVDPTTALNRGGRAATPTRTQRRVGGALVVVEVALSLVLLSGAGLLIHSFVRLHLVDPGFDMRNLLVTAIQLPRERYPGGAAQLAFLERVAESVRNLPDVAAVTIAGGAPPGSGFITFGVVPEAEGQAEVPFPSRAYLPVTPISPDYFATLGIPLLQGRTFTPADHNQRVLIVNETLARRYWGGESPVGRRFRLNTKDDWFTVVGVAADVRQMGYDDPNGSDMELYRPLSRGEDANNYYTLIARASGDPRALLPAINALVWSLDERLPIHKAATIEALYAETLREERFYLSLMAAFAIAAGLLATVGIYGVISYEAGQRTREFGLRLALGATRRDLRRLVLRSAALLTGLGVAAGLGGAVWLTRLLEAQLFEVAPADPLTLGVVSLALGAIAVGASYVPARRACRLDPMKALRME